MSLNFALILFWLMIATGLVWFADALWLRRRRLARTKAALARFDEQSAGRTPESRAALDADRENLRGDLMRQPWWIEFPAGFFPVILVVFMLRSFLFEPFRIPSGSMIPTLLIGDLILVNKFDYGIRLPILNRKIWKVGDPQRGDVMVFRYPFDTTTDYIKRVIGVPGDRVTYRDHHLEINGQVVPQSPTEDFLDEARVTYTKQFLETLPGPKGPVEHRVLNEEGRSQQFTPFDYKFRDNCQYSENNTVVSCVVPPDHYFMMGDNRDNSQDSRYWGFVPDENIVGKAFFIWMNFGNIKRIGSFQ